MKSRGWARDLALSNKVEPSPRRSRVDKPVALSETRPTFHVLYPIDVNFAARRATRGEFAISFNGETIPNVDAGTTEVSSRSKDEI